MLTLTRQEALEFIDNRLGVKGAEKLFEENRFRLLNDLILAFYNNIPFQTLTNMVFSPDVRRAPSVAEIKNDIFSGKGGMCISLNGFFQALLSTLGYDCYLTGGKMFDTESNTHAMTIVQNLVKANDAYLVEVGVAYPTLSAISLDFELESPTVVELVWWGRIVRVQPEDGEVQHHPVFLRQRKLINPEEAVKLGFGVRGIPDSWNPIYRFKLEPQSFAELHESIDTKVYRIPSQMLNRSLFLVRLQKNRAIILRDNNLVTETGDGVCQRFQLETDEDITDAIVRHFPVFDRDIVKKAIEQWRQMPRPQSS